MATGGGHQGSDAGAIRSKFVSLRVTVVRARKLVPLPGAAFLAPSAKVSYLFFIQRKCPEHRW